MKSNTIWIIAVLLCFVAFPIFWPMESWIPSDTKLASDCVKQVPGYDYETGYEREGAHHRITRGRIINAYDAREQSDAKRSEIDQDCKVAAYTKALARITIVLVLVTGVLGIATFITAVAAKQSADHIPTVERAYISVEPRGITLRSKGDAVIGQIGMRNVGHVPARNLRWFTDIKVSTNGDEVKFPIGSLVGNNVALPNTVLPRGTRPSVALQDILAPQSAEQVYLYVWGRVEYQNGFKRMCFTNFCHRYNWVTQGRDDVGQYQIAARYARYHEHGNDAD
jgi:hypothetical protein